MISCSRNSRETSISLEYCLYLSGVEFDIFSLTHIFNFNSQISVTSSWKLFSDFCLVWFIKNCAVHHITVGVFHNIFWLERILIKKMLVTTSFTFVVYTICLSRLPLRITHTFLRSFSLYCLSNNYLPFWNKQYREISL